MEAAKAVACKVQDHKKRDQDDKDDHCHFHPAWCAEGSSVIRPHLGAGTSVAGLVLVGGWFSQVRILCLLCLLVVVNVSANDQSIVIYPRPASRQLRLWLSNDPKSDCFSKGHPIDL